VETWAFIATAVVAVAGIAATFFAPSWSERTIERRREARDFRAAKRLVALELRRLTFDLNAIGGAPTAFDPASVGFLDLREWDAHKATLARSLPDNVWVSVRDTYTTVEKTRAALTIAGTGADGYKIDDEQRHILAELVRLTKLSLDALDPPTE
jgi:type II secretory pathway pseudopilin PulG